MKQLPGKTWGERAFLINLYKRISDPEPLAMKEITEPRAAGSIVMVKKGGNEPQTTIRPVLIGKRDERRTRRADIGICNGRFVLISS